MNKLIAISGPAGSGKSLVARMLRYYGSYSYEYGMDFNPDTLYTSSLYDIRQFAGKLKQVVSLLTGIPVENLERQDIKDSELPQPWHYMENSFKERLSYSEYNALNPLHRSYYREVRPTVRQMLQEIGSEGLRGFHPDTHINALFSEWTPESKWIISDLRFPNEFYAIKAHGGITVRVSRPIDTTGAMYQHESETALEGFKFDYYIENNGTINELLEKVKNELHLH